MTGANMTTGYVKSAEWDLLGAYEERNSKKYPCCDNKLADVTITIRIRRRPLFYVFNLVIPCALILSMILLGFFLPPESGERITLSITILLAMAVFLQLVGEALPRNSETVPLLGRFYITIMSEIAVSLILTCWVLNVHYHGTGTRDAHRLFQTFKLILLCSTPREYVFDVTSVGQRSPPWPCISELL